MTEVAADTVCRILKARGLTDTQLLVAIGIAISEQPPKPATAEIAKAVAELRTKGLIANRRVDGTRRVFRVQAVDQAEALEALKHIRHEPAPRRKIVTTITIETTEA